MFDSHIHTNFSSDSDMKIEEVINVIKSKDIGVILTEHLDLNYPDENMFRLDIDSYFKAYEKHRSDKLLIGIEIGLDEEELADDCKRIANNYNFDFILGSTHLVEGVDIYEEEYYKNKATGEVYDLRSIYDKYFNAMLRLIKKNPYFDSMAHIDYIPRYASRFHENTEIIYKEYSYIIDEILKELISMDKALEINTRRLNDKETVNNLIPIYKKFKEFGGKYVTIGSDSHSKDAIAMNFSNALEIAEHAELTPVYFKERKIKLLNI
ncbi:putative histidinol-phosphatase HisK [Clostridium cylindrosporum DSM 605]|uniref:Histidinol-phosphatase n=2 Tax=Clostridium cylindrosporum TaxID=1495 RepID=A0A0J8DA46_CLOCY|nr:putative histidinol-phosphatase HisK [Clostridium cylindrosporum DSM 605]